MEILKLEDLTPLAPNEHWETWTLLIRREIRIYSWFEWIGMWRTTLDNYWTYQDEKRG